MALRRSPPQSLVGHLSIAVGAEVLLAHWTGQRNDRLAPQGFDIDVSVTGGDFAQGGERDLLTQHEHDHCM
jgi:hypothetical protein